MQIAYNKSGVPKKELYSVSLCVTHVQRGSHPVHATGEFYSLLPLAGVITLPAPSLSLTTNNKVVRKGEGDSG